MKRQVECTALSHDGRVMLHVKAGALAFIAAKMAQSAPNDLVTDELKSSLARALTLDLRGRLETDLWPLDVRVDVS